MNKEKRLMDIELELETFQAHIKRLKKKPDSVHRLDVELLQDKTRKLYDNLYELELLVLGRVVAQERTINLPENMPKGEIPETTETKIVVPPGSKTEEPAVVKQKPAQKVEEKKEEPVIEVEKPKVEKLEKVEPNREEISKDSKQKIKHESEIKPEPIQNEVRSTIDLFTDSGEVSIGDKLGNTGSDASIASKMQKSPIQNLKQAIGINEKFLFINELFNGDLGRYNKAIDEFSDLPSHEGTSAHLIELKIQNQWDESSEAFRKLKVLLDRKFD